MQQSLFISSTGHLALLSFMVFFGWGVNKNIETVPVPLVKVSVISVSEFDATRSDAPNVLSTEAPKTPKSNDQENQLIKIEQEDSNPDLSELSEKLKLENRDEKFSSNIAFEPVLPNKYQNIILINDKKIKMPASDLIKEQQGNEKSSFTIPKIAKPKPRTADRIDKVAVSKSSSQRVVEKPKMAIKVSTDALKVAEITKAEAPKETATQIVPEGKKNEPIVVSGAVQTSLPPPARPEITKKNRNLPIKRPKASQLLQKNKQSEQIEALLAQIETSLEPEIPLVSIIEKNSMMSAIAQKLAKYWEQGILAGNSNFEKYVVQVEVEVNSIGEIVGVVKPLEPTVPKGRYLIAFRQASNAIISAGTLPVLAGKYPAGVTFKITFDPENGFSF